MLHRIHCIPAMLRTGSRGQPERASPRRRRRRGSPNPRGRPVEARRQPKLLAQQSSHPAFPLRSSPQRLFVTTLIWCSNIRFVNEYGAVEVHAMSFKQTAHWKAAFEKTRKEPVEGKGED